MKLFVKSFIRAGTSVGLFLVGLIAGQMVVQWVGGELRPDLFELRLDHFSTHRSQIDTVFIGTSRIHRHVDPNVFDYHMSRRGFNTSSINLAIPGLISHEAARIIPELVSSEASPRLFIVETLPNTPPKRILERFQRSYRFYWWRSPAVFVQKSVDIFQSGIPLLDKVEKIRDELEWLLISEFRVGKGTEIVEKLVSSSDSIKPQLEQKVFEPLTKESMGVARYEERRKTLAGFSDTLTKRYRSINQFGTSEDHQKFRQRVTELIPDGEYDVIFIAPPGSVHFYDRDDASFPALFLNDPTTYPDLYDVDNWVDTGHLNANGAKSFSELLANAIADELTLRGL